RAISTHQSFVARLSVVVPFAMEVHRMAADLPVGFLPKLTIILLCGDHAAAILYGGGSLECRNLSITGDRNSARPATFGA
ncbi:hypothetical protein, partial [Salmonella enterica]|uniref:hypothetical protein n=1 Tax=Salmonella enterica TaxID=28901 RepID=UPI00307E8C0A